MDNAIKTRNYNIEILRIISMLMIIAGHAIVHGNIYDILNVNSVNFYIVKLFDIVFNVATNIYVLISGYLLCDKTFKIKRAFGLWFQVLFYAAVIYAILILTGQINFSFVDLIKVIFPISGNQYWFARVYIGLYLTSPFLNILINALNKKQFELLLFLCVLLFSLWPSFIPFATTLNSEGGSSIIWFCVLYMFAAYMKKYGINIKKIGHLCITTAIFILFSYLTSIFIPMVCMWLDMGYRGSSMFSTFSSFPMLFGALGILFIALKLPQVNKGIKFIGFFSTSTFSVYLIHDNKYIRDIIWEALKIPQLAEEIYIIPYIILISLLIFIVSVVLDKIFYVQMNKLISKIEFVRLQSKINSFLYKQNS